MSDHYAMHMHELYIRQPTESSPTAGRVQAHPGSFIFLCWTLSGIFHQTYFHTSMGQVNWII